MTFSSQPTSAARVFLGREMELAQLQHAYASESVALVVIVGPGGQGKTAMVQQFLTANASQFVDGVFFWSFYHAKDVDLCLRSLLAKVQRLSSSPCIASSTCVDWLLPQLKCEKWVVILDGLEVVQYDQGEFCGRIMHAELHRLMTELAGGSAASLVLATSRFPVPELKTRGHARCIHLMGLEPSKSIQLLRSMGMHGSDKTLSCLAESCLHHPKAVELAGIHEARFVTRGAISLLHVLQDPEPDLETQVCKILNGFRREMAEETQDVLFLALMLREPLPRREFIDYVRSAAITELIQNKWSRRYPLLEDRSRSDISEIIDNLLDWRLLEEVEFNSCGGTKKVLESHPLVRRYFEHHADASASTSLARAKYLHGRPDREVPGTLQAAQAEIEMFHAYADAEMWEEAESTMRFLDRPRYRFLAPALELDLLRRFHWESELDEPVKWSGFKRQRDEAICWEMLGEYQRAVSCYEEEWAPLGGDSLLILGEIKSVLEQNYRYTKWPTLSSAYRSHALALAGCSTEAASLCRTLVPRDVYEWHHVFECMIRVGILDGVDLAGLFERASQSAWEDLSKRRIRADYLRLKYGCDRESESLLAGCIVEGDRCGLPFERSLARLSVCGIYLRESRWIDFARESSIGMEIASRYCMRILQVDWLELCALREERGENSTGADQFRGEAQTQRLALGYKGMTRP